VLHNGTFDIVFILATPFSYDPTQGNLLLNFNWTSTPVTNGNLSLSASYSSSLVGSESSTTQYGTFSAPNTGVATDFLITPEPNTFLLTGLVLVVVGCSRPSVAHAFGLARHPGARHGVKTSYR